MSTIFTHAKTNLLIITELFIYVDRLDAFIWTAALCLSGILHLLPFRKGELTWIYLSNCIYLFNEESLHVHFYMGILAKKGFVIIIDSNSQIIFEMINKNDIYFQRNKL